MRTFNLNLAGLRFRIEYDRCSSWGELENRFADYVENGNADTADFRWRVRETLPISPNSDRDGAVVLPQIGIDAGRLIVTQPNYRGAFDLKGGEGEAEVNPTFPAFSSLLRGFLSAFLATTDGLLLHSAGLVGKSGRAVLVSGASESGKTTTSREFLDSEPAVTILSDELVPLRCERDGVVAYGSPFWGELRWFIERRSLRNNVRARVSRIFFIERGESNDRRPLRRKECAEWLLRDTLLRADSTAMIGRLLGTCEHVSGAVPTEHLRWKERSYLLEAVRSSLE